MKLRITGGYLEVEVIGEGLEDITLKLKKLAITPEEQIKVAGTKYAVNSSKSKMQNKLGAKSRMPI